MKDRSENKIFGEGTKDCGEIDLLLEDGDIAILIEAKTTLKMDDVREHIERLEKYRRHIDSNGNGEKRCYIGAVV
ncbi:MAG: PD-(D/E)XK nuclease family protein, partial [Planctomycetaceae bacterium]|nr:PD-(D/E)XK nuclease family protein [Planctomycetaceae bacterium]